MTLEELKKLIADDESETVEVKETTGQRPDACETLCAFLNKDCGTVAAWDKCTSSRRKCTSSRRKCTSSVDR